MPVFTESPQWVKSLDSEVEHSVPAGAVPVKVEK
jgi:hypothetical protein